MYDIYQKEYLKINPDIMKKLSGKNKRALINLHSISNDVYLNVEYFGRVIHEEYQSQLNNILKKNL